MKKLISALLLSLFSLTAFSATQRLNCNSEDGAYTANLTLRNVSSFEEDLKKENSGVGTLTMKNKEGKAIGKKDIKVALQGLDDEGFVFIMSEDTSDKLDTYFMISAQLNKGIYGKAGATTANISFDSAEVESLGGKMNCVSSIK